MMPQRLGRNWRQFSKAYRGQKKVLNLMTMTNSGLERTSQLEDRIRQLRVDIEAIIDARAEAVAKESPGVPVSVIRNLLTARAPACPCAQYLGIVEG
jgi:hypothetical protein